MSNDGPCRKDMELYIVNNSSSIGTEKRKSMLGILVNNFGLKDMIMENNLGSMINLANIKDDAVIKQLFDFIRLKKNVN